MKGNVAIVLRQCYYCSELHETTKHALLSYSLAQHVWNIAISLFLTINAVFLFSWGSTVFGVLHSNLLLYKVDDAPKAMTVINQHLILVPPFQQPRKQLYATHVWKTVSTVTLWILWKYHCKRRYDSIIPLL